MVKVCDTIMGGGKTSAAITYINSHPEKKILYITPYKDEATRINRACPNAMFVEPSDKIPAYDFSKSMHTNALIPEGRNIASTHQAMMYYTSETIQQLKEQHYTLIIDEELNVLHKVDDVTASDIQVAIEAGYINKTETGEYQLTGKEYGGGKFNHLFRMLKSRQLVKIDGVKGLWYWIFTKELLTEIEDVIVMTYLFDGSTMESFMKMFHVPYRKIGIYKAEDGTYSFADHSEYFPDYIRRIESMIHIEDDVKLNRIGDGKTALSDNWYKTRSAEEIDQVRKNLVNYFRNRMGWCPVKDRLCGKFKSNWGKIRDKGYYNSDLIFSQKATNAYRNCKVLAYPVNVIVNPKIANFYEKNGAPINRDVYSLSIMIQWIWRSAIRDGKEIWIYVPSRRMRELLKKWLRDLSSTSSDE